VQYNDPTGFFVTSTDPTIRAGVNAFNGWLQSPEGARYIDTFDIVQRPQADGGVAVSSDRRDGNVINTADTVSKGWEFEAIYNPTRSWRMSLSAGQQQAVKDNVAPAYRRWINDVLMPLLDGPWGQLPISANAAETRRQEFERVTLVPLRSALAGEGLHSPEVREWRFSGVTNYTFREGRLKGWAIGGAVRWQDKGAIGYASKIEPGAGLVYDVTRPYYAPAQTDVDAWVRYTCKLGKRVTWTAQLNVKNIGVGNELIPVQVQPDGTRADFRIRESQTWTLSNTFSF
jgi:outer membrane receptor protein involved in Fe transport